MRLSKKKNNEFKSDNLDLRIQIDIIKQHLEL